MNAPSPARGPAARPELDRTLHVAALPFPSPQGTQAAIDAMLRALWAADHAPELVTYAHGAPGDYAPPFALTRARERLPYRSLRSGPSAQKLLADVALGRALGRALQAGGGPRVVIAHHVEAAWLARIRGVAPRVFFAHTDLARELPSYAPASLAPLLAASGAELDRALVRGSHAVAAISPALAATLQRAAGPHAARVRYVPTPWPLPPPIEPSERAFARRALGSAQGAELIGYAGNLDGYQGWPALLGVLGALAARRPALRLVVATESDAGPLWLEARRAGVADRLHVITLAGEGARRRVHAAIDLALVPRAVPGGLPIKLLEALGRGVACVVSPSARAELPIAHVAAIAGSDGVEALAAEVDALLDAPLERARRAQLGREHVAREHAPERFLDALRAVVTLARAAARPS